MSRIVTPITPPKWPIPAPPKINTRPPTDAWFGHPIPAAPPQRPPIGGPLPTIAANSRHPFTNAPIRDPSLPPDAALPLASSGAQHPPANARHPVTGMKLVIRGPVPPGWEL